MAEKAYRKLDRTKKQRFPKPRPGKDYNSPIGPEQPQRANPRQYPTPIGPNQPSVSQKIGMFLKRGVDNFKENSRRPLVAPRERREEPPRRAAPPQPRERVPPMNMGGFGNDFGGGLDLSMHPDPMVSGMYGRGRNEPIVKRKKSGNVTEIHYHYH